MLSRRQLSESSEAKRESGWLDEAAASASRQPPEAGTGAATAPPPAPACVGNAAKSDAGSPAGKPGALRPRSDHAETSPLCAAARGSEVSPSHLPEHVDIERLLTDDPLQAAVLLLQRPQPHNVLRPHRFELRPAALIGLHRHLQMPTDRIDISSLSKQPIGLTQLPHDLLRRMPLPL